MKIGVMAEDDHNWLIAISWFTIIAASAAECRYTTQYC